LKTIDGSIEEFYRDVRDAQSDCADPYLSMFIDCLLASADYESFYKVMSKEGAKYAAKKKLMTPSTKADAKRSSEKVLPEGKGGDMDDVADAKGGDRDRYNRDDDGNADDNDDRDYKRASHK
jgi:hypothetical protein